MADHPRGNAEGLPPHSPGSPRGKYFYKFEFKYLKIQKTNETVLEIDTKKQTGFVTPMTCGT